MRYVRDEGYLVCPIDRKRIERRKYTIEAFITNEDVLKKINKG